MNGRTPAEGRQADITVVVAVYNTLPYLNRCLTSVVEQSIGLDRLELIVVDDGSTDGSGPELDRFAARYPGSVRVIHQPNSGGPARPNNRALELATGRYVFFLGADDYLGPEALERLVGFADRNRADVTLGRLVGVNGRYIHQEIFKRNEANVSLAGSALPWSMSNTKLFRRELIERHSLRFPEHMRMLSDQPFTIAACLHANRISVLADYVCYFAVRRGDASNITFRHRYDEILRCTAALLEQVAELLGPGPERDALTVRHFSWEVGRLLRRGFLALDRATQEQIYAGVGQLVDRYLTDQISSRLPVYRRLLFRLTQHGTVDDLVAFIRYDMDRGDPPIVVDGERWYAAYPGFRDDRRGWPDDWYDITEAAAHWLARLDATGVRWGWDAAGRRTVTVTARSQLPDLAERWMEPMVLTAGPVSGQAVGTAADPDGTTVLVDLPVDDLVALAQPAGDVHVVQAHVRACGASGTSPVRARGLRAASRVLFRCGIRLYVVTVTANHNGRLIIAVTPVTARRVVDRLSRRLARRAQSGSTSGSTSGAKNPPSSPDPGGAVGAETSESGAG